MISLEVKVIPSVRKMLMLGKAAQVRVGDRSFLSLRPFSCGAELHMAQYSESVGKPGLELYTELQVSKGPNPRFSEYMPNRIARKKVRVYARQNARKTVRKSAR